MATMYGLHLGKLVKIAMCLSSIFSSFSNGWIQWHGFDI